MASNPSPDSAPSPGERLLYALGQLYRLHRSGELSVEPGAFDVDDLARIIGVRVEFMSEGRQGLSFHLPDEVLVMDRAEEFPWRLRTATEWAFEEEAADLGGAGFD